MAGVRRGTKAVGMLYLGARLNPTRGPSEINTWVVGLSETTSEQTASSGVIHCHTLGVGSAGKMLLCFLLPQRSRAKVHLQRRAGDRQAPQTTSRRPADDQVAKSFIFRTKPVICMSPSGRISVAFWLLARRPPVVLRSSSGRLVWAM